jgi:hypothetical protein
MLNVSAFSLSVSACLAGLWGMNLKVPLEEGSAKPHRQQTNHKQSF